MAHAIPMLEVLPSTSIDCDDGRTPELAAAYKDPIDNANGPNGVFLLDGDGNGVGTWIPRAMTASDLNAVVLVPNELAVTTDTDEIRKGDVAETVGGINLTQDNSSVVSAHARGTPAENGVALLAAYTRAKALTPGGSAKSATNPAVLRVKAGVYTLASPLTLNEQYVHVIGEGPETTIINTDGDNNILVNEDNITIQGLKITQTSAGTAELGSIHINAGAGGSYAAANAGLRFIDLTFSIGSTLTTTTLNASITTLAIFAQRCITNVGGLFLAATQTFFGTPVALTCSGKFWDCVMGVQLSPGANGGFGGTASASATPNIFTGELRSCRSLACYLGIRNRGLVSYCRFRCSIANKVAIHAGQGGKFYHSVFYQGTTSVYSIGYFEDCSVTIDHCSMRANGIDTTDHGGGATITNLIGTPMNTMDDDLSSTM